SRVVEQQLSELAPGTVPDFRAVERQITEANRHFASRQVTVLPRAGATQGTIDIEARVKDSLPLTASVDLSNNYNRDTAPLRLNLQVGHNDLWKIGHQASFGYGVAPENPDNSQIFSGSYTAPILGTPWSATLSGITSNSNVALSLGSQTVIGNGYTIGVRAQYELPPRNSLFQVVRFGSDYKDYEQEITSTVGGVVTQRFPSVQWVTLVGDYVLQNFDERGTTSLTVGGTFGIRTLSQQLIEIVNDNAFLPGAPPTVEVPAFPESRSRARGTFAKINADFTHTHNVWNDLQLVGRVEGQVADGPLLPNEQFSLGGSFSVRGYLVGEAIGDTGIAATAEVRSPSFATLFGSFVDELRFHVFLDAGHVVTLRPQAEQASSATLASFGAGSRIQLFQTVTGELAVAVPIRDGDLSQASSLRMHFSIRAGF
ncbi:MAG: ShlB/FhaC/HecB family hemolysin secretion/activation protein, partial [Sandaracinobacteroides sp.]